MVGNLHKDITMRESGIPALSYATVVKNTKSQRRLSNAETIEGIRSN
jgi:hypothetical protein